MLADKETALRGFCARILGWSDERTQAIEHALRSIHLSVTHRAALVLLGDTDLVPIAQSIHRQTLGDEQPFVVCDQRQNISCLAAAMAARGGSLCVRRRRLPRDFPALVALLRDPHASTQIIVCAEAHHDSHPFLIRPVPIRVPPLTARASELPRIIDEFARDAIMSLGATATEFTGTDRDWVIARSASTLPEVEKGTRRLVALRQSGSIVQAAARLGMSHVALSQWFGRRGIGGRGKPKP
jgi:hypothetical protein